MAPSFEEWIPRIDDDVFNIPPRLRNDESDFGLEPAQRRPFFGLQLAADIERGALLNLLAASKLEEWPAQETAVLRSRENAQTE